MPSIAHHQLKVVVIVNRGRDVVVVVEEFGWGDFAISSSSNIEGVKEFSQDILLSLLSCDNIRVLLAVVGSGNIVDFNDSTLVLVKNLRIKFHNFTRLIHDFKLKLVD